CFSLIVYLLKLEIVEPDSAAAILAGIDGHFPDLKFDEFVETSGTFHGIYTVGCRWDDVKQLGGNCGKEGEGSKKMTQKIFLTEGKEGNEASGEIHTL